MDLQQVVRHYHDSLDDFARGDPEPVRRLFSRRDDVTLANPFGPALRGWTRVTEALDFASSRFRDGTAKCAETIAAYVAPELATMLEIEEWRAKVSGAAEITPFTLRVTTTFRREDDTWRIVHRHADPITTFHPAGPLRSMNG